MAKSSSQGERGRVKFRVVEFELEGSDGSLQDALRNLANALGGNKVSYKAIGPAKGGAAASPALPDVDADEPEADEADDAPEPVRRSKAGKPSVSASPEIVKDLDLTSGDVPLKAFLEAKKPEGENKRYLAVAHWLKEHRKLESVGMDHVYTAYRSMGWNVPKDALMPFRNLKQSGWVGKGAARGEYSINHVGEGVVNNMGS